MTKADFRADTVLVARDYLRDCVMRARRFDGLLGEIYVDKRDRALRVLASLGFDPARELADAEYVADRVLADERERKAA